MVRFFLWGLTIFSLFFKGVDKFPGMCGRSHHWLNLRGSESGPWIRTFQHSLSKEVHTICRTTKLKMPFYLPWIPLLQIQTNLLSIRKKISPDIAMILLNIAPLHIYAYFPYRQVPYRRFLRMCRDEPPKGRISSRKAQDPSTTGDGRFYPHSANWNIRLT